MNASDAATELTREYAELVRHHLYIDTPSGFGPVFVPERVDVSNIQALAGDLDRLLADAQNAVQAVRSSEGAQLQSVLYGAIEDFDLAVRVGYLLGDRVVLWDLLSSQLLRKPEITPAHLDTIGMISAHELIERGHFVILPHPLTWHKGAIDARKELAKQGLLSPRLQGLAASLAVAQDFPVQPYTIEGADDYQAIAIDKEQTSGGTTEEVEYSSALSGILAGRLITDGRFERALRIPLREFQHVISERTNFYARFRQRLEESARMPSPDMDGLASELRQNIDEDNRADVDWEWQTLGTGVAGVFALIGAASNPITLAAAAVGAFVGVGCALNARPKNRDAVTAVFRILDAPDAESLEIANSPEQRHTFLLTLPPSVAKQMLKDLEDEEVEYNVNARLSCYQYCADLLVDLWSISPEAFWRHAKAAFEYEEPDSSGMLGGDHDVHWDIMQSAPMPAEVWRALLKSLLFDETSYNVDNLARVIRAQTQANNNAPVLREIMAEWYTSLDKAQVEHVRPVLQEAFENTQMPPWLTPDDLATP
jgi:hypothetical protein